MFFFFIIYLKYCSLFVLRTGTLLILSIYYIFEAAHIQLDSKLNSFYILIPIIIITLKCDILLPKYT